MSRPLSPEQALQVADRIAALKDEGYDRDAAHSIALAELREDADLGHADYARRVRAVNANAPIYARENRDAALRSYQSAMAKPATPQTVTDAVEALERAVRAEVERKAAVK